MSIKLSDITGQIPKLVTFDGEHDIPVKNTPIFEFQDSLLDYGRLFAYLNHLPARERNKKIKVFKKLYPEINLD